MSLIQLKVYAMIKYFCFLFIIYFVGCSSSLVNSSTIDDFQFSEINIKQLTERTSEGYLWFSTKINITNKTKSVKNVFIEIQGIDKEGFELKDFDLKCKLNPMETKTFTDRRFMPEKEFKDVIKWQVVSVEDF